MKKFQKNLKYLGKDINFILFKIIMRNKFKENIFLQLKVCEFSSVLVESGYIISRGIEN